MLGAGTVECDRLPTRGGNTVGPRNKIENTAGTAGTTGDESPKAEGQCDREKGGLKQAGEMVQDAFKD
jgi:hypothetical protein